jgi:hypothetical protein
LHQIIVHLQAEKETFRQAEIACQPAVSIGGKIAFAEHDLVDAARATWTARAKAFWLRSIGFKNSSSRISPASEFVRRPPLDVVVDDFDMLFLATTTRHPRVTASPLSREVLAVIHGEPRRVGHKRLRPSFETPR